MKLVVQRVKEAKVTVDNEFVGQIDHGLLVFVGVSEADTKVDATVLLNKLINLRIFEDDSGKMNLSLKDINGAILSVSQFTLYADVRKGRRPNFTKAARPQEAESLYNYFNEQIVAEQLHLETGRFGAMMDVQLINDGPVTIIMETIEGKIV